MEGGPYRTNACKVNREPKPGDVVELKSGGGPRMTYCYLTSGKAYCRYFNAKGDLYHHEIEPIGLVVIENFDSKE